MCFLDLCYRCQGFFLRGRKLFLRDEYFLVLFGNVFLLWMSTFRVMGKGDKPSTKLD